MDYFTYYHYKLMRCIRNDEGTNEFSQFNLIRGIRVFCNYDTWKWAWRISNSKGTLRYNASFFEREYIMYLCRKKVKYNIK